MNKCDFCPHSKNKDGKIVCPFSSCLISGADLQKILRAIERGNRK